MSRNNPEAMRYTSIKENNLNLNVIPNKQPSLKPCLSFKKPSRHHLPDCKFTPVSSNMDDSHNSLCKGKVNVLIVDDSIFNCLILETYLKKIESH